MLKVNKVISFVSSFELILGYDKIPRFKVHDFCSLIYLQPCILRISNAEFFVTNYTITALPNIILLNIKNSHLLSSTTF